MDMENKLSEMEEDNLLMLTDEEGNEVNFEVIDVVEYCGNEYVVLLPVEDNDGEVLILQVVSVDDEMEEYCSVDDEGILQSVFDVFKERCKDFIDFED